MMLIITRVSCWCHLRWPVQRGQLILVHRNVKTPGDNTAVEYLACWLDLWAEKSWVERTWYIAAPLLL